MRGRDRGFYSIVFIKYFLLKYLYFQLKVSTKKQFNKFSLNSVATSLFIQQFPLILTNMILFLFGFVIMYFHMLNHLQYFQ